jgi:spore coat polysaccharide biosynthesis protein SpsF
MARTAIVTQARMTSTRLPGKVLIEVGGRPLLDLHLDRLLASGHDVVVATTVNATDDPIVSLARNRGIEVFRGSESDVLSRYAGAIREFSLDTVVRVTSDCPLIDGALVADGITAYADAGDPDVYVSNAIPRSMPRGMDFEVFGGAALLEADALAGSGPQREHVTPYLYENVNGRTTVVSLSWPEDKSAYRVTLDTPDDLELIRVLIEEYDAGSLDCAGIIAVLDSHPELVAINAHVEQKKLGQ